MNLFESVNRMAPQAVLGSSHIKHITYQFFLNYKKLF